MLPRGSLLLDLWFYLAFPATSTSCYAQYRLFGGFPLWCCSTCSSTVLRQSYRAIAACRELASSTMKSWVIGCMNFGALVNCLPVGFGVESFLDFGFGLWRLWTPAREVDLEWSSLECDVCDGARDACE